jgi:hypothetical protein
MGSAARRPVGTQAWWAERTGSTANLYGSEEEAAAGAAQVDHLGAVYSEAILLAWISFAPLVAGLRLLGRRESRSAVALTLGALGKVLRSEVGLEFIRRLFESPDHPSFY